MKWPNIWALASRALTRPTRLPPFLLPRFGGVFFGIRTDANKMKPVVSPGPGDAVRIHLRIGRAEKLPRSAIEPPPVASTQPPGELVIEGSGQKIIGPAGLLDILPQVLQLLPHSLKVGV